MSSKKSKSNGNNGNIEQEALKEVEIIAGLAPNEKTRKEAEKLRASIEGKSAASLHKQELEGVDNMLLETKKALKNTANQAQIEIPKYTKVMGELQEEGIQATKLPMSIKIFKGRQLLNACLDITKGGSRVLSYVCGEFRRQCYINYQFCI